MPDISFPINPHDLNLNKLGLSPSNYLYGKRRQPTDEMFRTLMIQLSILFIQGVCPNLSDTEARDLLSKVNTQEWVLANRGMFVGSTRLIDEAIASGGSDGLRRLLGEGFEWVFTQSDLTLQMNNVRSRN